MSADPGNQQSLPSHEEPVWAELLGPTTPTSNFSQDSPFQPPPRRSRMPILGCALAFLLLLALGVGVVFFGYWAGSEPSSPLLAQPLTEDRQVITALVDGAWHATNDVKHGEMRQFLSDLEKAQARDQSTFANLVDWPSHMERFYKSYRWQPINPLKRFELKGIERTQFSMPTEASNFKIAAIQERGADDCYVYTYAQEGGLSNAAFLFHMRRQKGKWKLVDWADIAELRWEGERNGIATGLLIGDPQWTEQNQLIEEIEESDRLLQSDNIQGAEAALRQAENRSGIPQLQDSNFYLIAARWNVLNNDKEAERVLGRIRSPDAYPWAHHLSANLHFQRGKYAEALSAIERFEHLAGFHKDLAVIRTKCHAALKQKEQAERWALALVRYAPSDAESLSLALEHVSSERLSQLFELLSNVPETAQSLAQKAGLLLYKNAVESHRQIRDYLARKLPESPQVLELDASLLHYQGEVEQALAIYKNLLESELDQNQRQSIHSRYLGLQLRLKSSLEAYQEATNARETLERMTDGLGDDEALIGLGELEKILPLHRQNDADDPKLPWYAAQIAIQKRDWHTASSELKKAIESPSLEHEEEYWKEELRSQLLEARSHLGEGLDAYREARDPAAAYRSLASIMEQNNDWGTLQQLNALHRNQPQDLWARHYGLRVQEIEARKSQDPHQLAALLASYKALAAENSLTNTVYPWLLDIRLDELAVQTQTWQTYIASIKQPERLFLRLAARFRREQNQAALEELVAFARQRFPDSNELQQFELDQLWEQRDYAGIIAYCAAHPTDTIQAPYVGRRRQERLLISFLMQGDMVNAWKLASEPNSTIEQQWLVRLAEGNTEVVREFLKEHHQELHSPLSIDADSWRVPAIRKYLQSEEFRRVRTDSPMPFTLQYMVAIGIVFFPEPVSWTEDLIRERLSRAGLADVEVRKLAQPPLVTNTFSLRRGSGVCLLTYGDTPYINSADLQTYGQSLNPAFKAALSRHRHWMALEPQHKPDDNADQTWQQVLTAFLIDSIALWESSSAEDDLQVVVTPEIANQLAGHPEKLRTVALPSEENAWLARSEDSEKQVEEKRWYLRCRTVANGGKPGRVFVRFTSGHVMEEHWLNVVSVNHQYWGNYSIDAQLQEASVLSPLFSKGDMLRLSESEIQRWEE